MSLHLSTISETEFYSWIDGESNNFWRSMSWASSGWCTILSTSSSEISPWRILACLFIVFFTKLEYFYYSCLNCEMALLVFLVISMQGSKLLLSPFAISDLDSTFIYFIRASNLGSILSHFFPISATLELIYLQIICDVIISITFIFVVLLQSYTPFLVQKSPRYWETIFWSII